MKIGFDISQTGRNRAGCGYFSYSLIQTLCEIDNHNQYILYPYFGNSFWDSNILENKEKFNSANCTIKKIVRTKRDCFEFFSQLPADAEYKMGNPDIVHANNYSCPGKFKVSKVVYTLHDLHFLEHPEFSTEANRWNCFNGVYDAANHADFILSVSKYSLTKFLDIFPHFPPERIKVVYPASRFKLNDQNNEGNHPSTNLAPQLFLLAVGTLEPRKNLRRLLNAYAVYATNKDDALPLVFAGGKGWLEDDLEKFVHNLDLSTKVKFLGYVSDEELSWLYGNCLAFIYPSLYEGFGLPVLEAMSHGAAVVASNVTSIPEVGGEAVHYIDPLEEKEIVDAIRLLVGNSDYRQELKKNAFIQSQNFSWEKCATEVIEIYNLLMTLPKR